MNLRSIFYINGFLLLILAVAMLVPMMLDLANNSSDWRVFAGAQIITTLIGFLIISATRQNTFRLDLRGTVLLSSTSWLFVTLFGAIPFFLAEVSLPYTQAFFETMSAITTTGATVMTDLDQRPHGILAWRALLQWMGGLGFLVIAISILPSLQAGGMQIFRTQSSDVERVMPSTGRVLVYVALIYTALTLAGALALHAAGMTGFEAFCHAMSAISTGGFSTSDLSIGYFDSLPVELIVICLMLLGSMPFVLYVRTLRKGGSRSILDDGQVQSFLSVIVFFIILLAAYLTLTSPVGPGEALRRAAFKTVTLMTTTGFTSKDEALWGPFAVGLAFIAAFTGGCAGSTASGLKIFRLQILWSMLTLHIRKIITPNGLFNAHYAGKPLEWSLQSAIGAFFFAYIATFIITNAALMFIGLDFSASFASTASTLGNIGPTLSNTIVADQDFLNLLPPTALWILSAAMLLGRLEFFIPLALLAPDFWRR